MASFYYPELNLAVVFDTLPNIFQQSNVSHSKGSD
jgi:hypothetical protein